MCIRDRKYYVEMNEEQKKVYSSYIADIKEKMNDKDITKDKITIFSYLTKLRQLCLDPSVIVEGYNGCLLYTSFHRMYYKRCDTS